MTVLKGITASGEYCRPDGGQAELRLRRDELALVIAADVMSKGRNE